MFFDPLIGHPLVRRLADAGLVRYAHRRTAELDRLDVAETQWRTLKRRVHKARSTRFGREHGFDRLAGIEQYQSTVPVRTYEDFWREYWQATFPRMEGTTWPEFIPYYALSSGTTTGTTKYLPISR